MKKLLLVAINARYTHSCLALYCLKSAARGLDWEITVREFSINRDIDEILAGIEENDTGALALSVYIWNAELVKKILPVLKERNPGRAIVLGGPEVSYNPESWIRDFPCIDYIVTGQGEEAFRRLLESGLRHEKKIISHPNPPFAEMALPYADEDISSLRNRYLYYESSRGCPFQCTYCLSSRGDQGLELKRTETVMEELKFILRYRPKLIKFVDRTFNARRDHYRPIWKFLLDNYGGEPAAFHFEIHPSLLDDEDFTLLSRSPEGLFQFEIGVQSTNPETRAAVRRSGDWEKEKVAIGRVIGLGTIHVHLDMIAGLPHDDMRTLARTFNELYALGPDRLQVGFLKVLPGTEMMERTAEYGMFPSPAPPYQVLENRWLGRDDMRILEKIAFLTDRLYNTRRFSTTLAALAGLYESPFELYRDLAGEMNAAGRAMTRAWDSGAAMLMSLAASRFPGKNSFILDALRWDWCAGMQSHRYPQSIKPEDAAAIKKRGYAFYQSLMEDGVPRHQADRFRISDLKKAIFFKSESGEFSGKYMDDKSHALFLPEGRVLYYND